MIDRKETVFDRQRATEIFQLVMDRWEADRLTRVPLLYTNELPGIEGIYIAANDDREVFYIGKAKDLSVRCRISGHHKLPRAIEMGATVLYVAEIRNGLSWAVEQRLISYFSPPLNSTISCWWNEQPPVQKKKTTNKGRRIPVGLKLDGRVMEVIARYAEIDGVAPNRYIENLLWQHCQEHGDFVDERPLGETRGKYKRGG